MLWSQLSPDQRSSQILKVETSRLLGWAEMTAQAIRDGQSDEAFALAGEFRGLARRLARQNVMRVTEITRTDIAVALLGDLAPLAVGE